MPFFSEIFFSTLIGKPVYTIDEKYFGNFRDFIVKRQKENFLITKVRIRIPDGSRIIIPWQEVHSIDADPVSLKLQRRADEIKTLDYDDDELRLKRDFLDQQIIDTDAHRLVRVNDLKIVAVQDDLFMVAADIGIRGLLRRLGVEAWVLSIARIFRKSIENTLLPSKYIDPFPARIRHDITLTVAQEQLKKMHPADLADIVGDLDAFERLSILQSLPPEIMAKTIEELDPDIRKHLLEKLKVETLSEVLAKLAPDTATDIAAQLPKRRMHEVLNAMKTKEATEIRELLKFKKDTAGSLMNTQFVAFPETYTTHQVLEELQKKGEQAEQIFYLYVVDDKGILKGAISLRYLIFVDPGVQLGSMIKRKPIYAKTKEHVDEVVEKFTKYNLIAIPVVGPKKKLEGVITVDDILSLLQNQA